MAKHPLWKDEYWLLLLQLYQKKPMGVKPLYSKGMVDLSLELHIAPEYLHEQMFKLRLVTPRIKRLWEHYGDNPKKLARQIRLLKDMEGYGNATAFYQGVYQICDPYLNRNDVVISKLIDACSEIWQRYGNGNPDKLYKLANDLKEYFK